MSSTRGSGRPSHDESTPNDLGWDAHDGESGQVWGCRLEVFKTNPADEPDLHKFETELVFRLADEPDERR